MNILSIKDDSSLLQNPDVILREDEPGGPMLFNPDTNEMRILNETGLWVWHLCQNEIVLSKLITQMLDEYDEANQKQVDRDVRDFLKDMVEQGFIGITC